MPRKPGAKPAATPIPPSTPENRSKRPFGEALFPTPPRSASRFPKRAPVLVRKAIKRISSIGQLTINSVNDSRTTPKLLLEEKGRLSIERKNHRGVLTMDDSGHPQEIGIVAVLGDTQWTEKEPGTRGASFTLYLDILKQSIEKPERRMQTREQVRCLSDLLRTVAPKTPCTSLGLHGKGIAGDKTPQYISVTMSGEDARKVHMQQKRDELMASGEKRENQLHSQSLNYANSMNRMPNIKDARNVPLTDGDQLERWQEDCSSLESGVQRGDVVAAFFQPRMVNTLDPKKDSEGNVIRNKYNRPEWNTEKSEKIQLAYRAVFLIHRPDVVPTNCWNDSETDDSEDFDFSDDVHSLDEEPAAKRQKTGNDYSELAVL